MTKDDVDDRKLWRQRVTGNGAQLRETELLLAICVVKAVEMIYDMAWTVFHNEMQDRDDMNNEVGLVEYLSC